MGGRYACVRLGARPYRMLHPLLRHKPLAAFLGLVHKLYPCGMMSGIVISTTHVSEFMTATNRIHAPRTMVILLAVMLRYIPVIIEDFGYIRDAMKMRDIAPSFKGLFFHPVRTVECSYVPMMMTASHAADDRASAQTHTTLKIPRRTFGSRLLRGGSFLMRRLRRQTLKIS